MVSRYVDNKELKRVIEDGKLKSFKIRKSAVEEFLKENEGNDLSDIDNIKKISTNNEEGQ